MATQYRQLQEFELEADSIKAYLERISLYLTANDVSDGKKVLYYLVQLEHLLM